MSELEKLAVEYFALKRESRWLKSERAEQFSELPCTKPENDDLFDTPVSCIEQKMYGSDRNFQEWACDNCKKRNQRYEQIKTNGIKQGVIARTIYRLMDKS